MHDFRTLWNVSCVERWIGGALKGEGWTEVQLMYADSLQVADLAKLSFTWQKLGTPAKMLLHGSKSSGYRHGMRTPSVTYRGQVSEA